MERIRSHHLNLKGNNTVAFSTQNSKGKTYYLHAREFTLRGGRKQTFYFFAPDVRDGALDSVPAGHMVSESKSGLLVLKKAKAPTA